MASTVKTLIKSVREYKKPSIITPFFMAIEAFCECLIPFFMAKMIDAHALSQANAMHNILTYGGILLALVLTLWIRERRHEIGILMSLGISKVSIWKQFLLETAIIALAAMVVAFALSVPCSRMLSEKAFDVAETMAQSQAEEVRDPMADVMEKLNPTAEAAVDVVQKDDVHLTFAACITIVLCTAGIITISVTLSAVPMFRMKPKEILYTKASKHYFSSSYHPIQNFNFSTTTYS